MPAANGIRRLFAPVDIASLVYFRVAFGAIMVFQVGRYLADDWIGLYWIAPKLNFSYYGFGWVRPWPVEWMYVHVVAVGVLALFVMVGFHYRLSAFLFFLGFTYLFLIEQSKYLNHLYLVCLLSFLMIFLPAHRAGSVDARRRPWLRADVAPAWTLWLLRAQIGVVYFYAGVAKLNPDWLGGEPMRLWLSDRARYPLIGGVLSHEASAYFFSYGGLLLDLFVVPALLYRRTRVAAFALALWFHLANALLFQIGIFPWLMIAATLLYFPPDWPRRALRLWWPRSREGVALEVAGAPPARLGPRQYAAVACLAVYAAVQILVPLRHFLYPGDVNWTEEGHRFSWHMLLRSKRGTGELTVSHPASGKAWRVDLREHLSDRQIEKMPSWPDMILQFSHYLAEWKRREGYDDVAVHADIQLSLNGRPLQRFIDPEVNLAAQPRNLWPAPWILPLE